VFFSSVASLVDSCSIIGAFIPAIAGMVQETLRVIDSARAKSRFESVKNIVNTAERRRIRETADFNTFFFKAHLR